MPANNQKETVGTGMGQGQGKGKCIHPHLSPSQTRGIANKGPFSGARRGSGHCSKNSTKQKHN